MQNVNDNPPSTKIATPKKGLGIWLLTALVIGNMIGSGIFLLPSSLASYGTISIFSWLLTAVGSILLALVFVDLSRMFPKTGGPYVYCREGFGDFIGFLITYNRWIAVWVSNAAISVGLVGYLGFFWPVLSEHATQAYDPFVSFIVKAAIIWLLTFINILGVRNAGILQLITTIIKTVPLFIISIAGLLALKPAYLLHFNTSGQSNFNALTSAATLTLWAFIGLESATIPADEANDPNDVPRATIFGTLITAFIYILSTVAVMGLIPATELKNSATPFADAASQLFGSWAGLAIAVCAVISSLGALNGWILIQGQLPMAAARDGLFPATFAKKSRYGTPAMGMIISSALMTLLLALTLQENLVKQFTFIVLLATLACLIPYFISAISELLILLNNPLQFSHRRLIRSAIVAILAACYTFWAMAGSGMQIVYYGSLLFFSGFPIYAWIKWQHSK